MAKKGADKKGERPHEPGEAASMRLELPLAPLQIRFDEPLRLSHDVAPIRQGLRLDPISIRFDEPFHLKQEAAPIRRRVPVRDAQSLGVPAPPAHTVEEPAAVEEIQHVEFHDSGLHEEALETPREAVVEAEKASSADREGFLAKVRRQWPRPSLEKIFEKFSIVGRWSNKSFFLASMILLSVALVGGISVVGLLQSAERIGTAGIVIRPSPPPPQPPPPPPPPPPEPAVEIDVYSDSGCTQVLSAVEWGSIEAGDSVNKKAYIKNSGDQSVTLSLTTENWVPAGAADYITLSWNYDGSALGPGAVVEVTLTLTVDSAITGIEDFNFDIVIIGSAS